MPLIVAAILGALASAMGSLVGRAIIALGIGFVTYSGIDVAIGALKTQAQSGVTSIGGDTLAFIGYLWLDKAISIIFSAITIALSMKVIGGSVKKMVFK